jgi:hypothetical protein
MINLPVSIGEALDKLSILEIKVEKLQKDRKIYAKNEFDILLEKTNIYVENNNTLYVLLKKINLIIWNEMDLLRDKYESMTNDEYFQLCKKCIDDNDKRFRIKNKINNVYNSSIKEQKSYIETSLLLYLTNDKFSSYHCNIIQYFSIFYDKLYIVTYDNEKIKEKFNYDNDIKFIEIKKKDDIKEIYLNYNNFIYDDNNIELDYGKKISIEPTIWNALHVNE